MKKLIYFNIGSNEELIKIANLCLTSLNNVKYSGDFLFITNFHDKLIQNIKIKNNVYFLQIDECFLSPAFYRFKIFEFEKIYLYDKIIYCDVDVLFTESPNLIFEQIEDNYISVTNDNIHETAQPFLMTSEIDNIGWWGKHIFEPEEIKYIDRKKIQAINAGFFAFNRTMLPHFRLLDKFVLNNSYLINETLDQSFFNVYLFRNNIYQANLNKYVTHNAQFNMSIIKPIMHFAGSVGDAKIKFDAMNLFLENYTKNYK